ncbi:MAG: ATP-binding protein [Saprospiraceae bacterium]|nr:ATP-binding protein [Saprospiraceae bacterium]
MKIVFTGPESTGKSTIATWLSQLSGIYLVKEVAREYMESLEIPYEASHVREIGLLQQFDENLRLIQHRDIICDTDLLTIIIWLQVKYNFMDQHLLDMWVNSTQDLYFLCLPDIPWEADPLRENPHNRDELFTVYQNYLIQHKKPFVLLSGSIQDRQEFVCKTISNLTGKILA